MPLWRLWPRSAAPVVTLLLIAVCLAVQMAKLGNLVRADGFLGVGEGRDVAAGYLAAVGGFAIMAAIIPKRWTGALVGAVALLPLAAVSATASRGGWALLMAALTLIVCHEIGRLILDRLLRPLPDAAVAAILRLAVGIATLSVLVLLVGRLGAISRLTVGVPVLVGGALGAVRLARGVRRPAGWESPSRLVTVVSGILLGQLALGIVWATAPEVMYDALHYKAWLPSLWSDTGRIEFLAAHPLTALSGTAQIVAVPGHTLGAAGIGRFLQLGLAIAIVGLAWLWGRRFNHAVAALVALAIGITPHFVWQASTAYDDLFVTFFCVAIALVVVEIGPRQGRFGWGASVVPGLVAGGALAVKLHAAPFVVAAAAAWVVVALIRDRVMLAPVGVFVGGLAAAGPFLVARWLDTGNPVFPQLNAIFGSDQYPRVNETWNFPFVPDAGLGQIPELTWKALTEPSLMLEAAPVGVLALLPALLLGALIAPLVPMPRAQGLALRIALIVGIVVWWVEFRYLRYLLPLLVVGALMIIPATSHLASVRESVRGVVARTRLGAALVAVPALAFFPSSLASFWNIPERLPLSVATGGESIRAYESRTIPESRALRRFSELAQQGDLLVGDAYARTLVDPALAISPLWELEGRIALRARRTDTAKDAFTVWRSLNTRWLLLRDEHRQFVGIPEYVRDLVESYGTIVYSASNRDLYRIDERPQSCDLAIESPRDSRRPQCDRQTLGDLAAGVVPTEGRSSTVLACGGTTYGVLGAVEPSAAPARIWLRFDQDLAAGGYTDIAPGSSAVLHGTAPGRSGRLSVFVQGLGGPTQLSRAVLADVSPGRGCRA